MPTFRADLRPILMAGLAAFLAGCGADESAHAGLTEMSSPAGLHSGEPHLAQDGDGLILSWIERVAEGRHQVRMARLEATAWTEPRVVVEGDDFFVNWADFPSVVALGDGVLAAHWLQRGPAGGYDYGVRMRTSGDGGHTWSETWTPHDDTSPTEHGFVSIFSGDEGPGVVWLDGRDFVTEEVRQGTRGPRMSLRYRGVPIGDHAGPEMLIDGRVCDCCQTAAAVTGSGVVVAYRDRSEAEIRDISVVRYEGGRWTEPRTVHDDGWHITGCPVNGPALAADADRVALAWFTGADDEPRVRLAFSHDGGATFGEPVRIDGGSPAGRVDVQMLADGDAVVSWLERGDGRAEIRVRRAAPDGSLGPAVTLTPTSDARASGFPQLALHGESQLVLAWTDSSDPPRVRVGTAVVPSR